MKNILSLIDLIIVELIKKKERRERFANKDRKDSRKEEYNCIATSYEREIFIKIIRVFIKLISSL